MSQPHTKEDLEVEGRFIEKKGEQEREGGKTGMQMTKIDLCMKLSNISVSVRASIAVKGYRVHGNSE